MVAPSEDFTPAYKDRFLRTKYSEPLDYLDECSGSFVTFPDLTTPITYPIQLNQTQWEEIAACILQGSVIIYPNSVQRIYYNFVRALECDLTDCSSIIACLNDPESGVSDAFNEWLVNQLNNDSDVNSIIQGGGGDGSTAIKLADEELFAECDLDLLFGWSLQVVQMANLLIIDLYEILEAITNDIEMLATLAAEAPLLGTVVGYAAWLQQSALENYSANYGIDLQNDYACEIFCIARDNPECAITWTEITNHFAKRLSYSLQDKDIGDVLTFFITGSWTGDEWCDVAFLALSYVMQIGGDWAGISLRKIQQIMQSFMNDPDSDWETLCDCGWVFTEEFDDGFGIFSLTTYGASWSPTTRGAEGLGDFLQDTINEYTPLNRHFQGIAVTATFNETNITGLSLEYSALIDGEGNSTVRFYNGAVLQHEEEFQLETTGGTPEILEFELDEDVTSIEISLVDGFLIGTDPAGSCNLDYVKISGLGVNPFI